MERNELIKKLRTELRQLDQILSQWNGTPTEIAHLRTLYSTMFEENLRLIFLTEWTPPAMDPLPMIGVPPPTSHAVQEKSAPEHNSAPAKSDEKPTPVAISKPEMIEVPKPESVSATATPPEKTDIDAEILVKATIATPEPAQTPEPAAPVTKEKAAPAEKMLSRLVDAVAPPRLEDKLRNARVEDLKKAIPLHEKFLYINELYQGEHGLYNAFIELLNQCKDHKDADQQFKLEIRGRGWDSEGEVVCKLWSTVQRKFPAE